MGLVLTRTAVGADSISALFGGGYGIRPYSLDQKMIKALFFRSVMTDFRILTGYLI